MDVTHVSSFMDGGTLSVTLDGHIPYYIDNRITTDSRGRVFDAYPTHGKPLSDAKLLEFTEAVLRHNNDGERRKILKLMGIL